MFLCGLLLGRMETKKPIMGKQELKMLLIKWVAWVVFGQVIQAGQTKVVIVFIVVILLIRLVSQVYSCLKQFHPEKNQIPQLTLLLPDSEIFSLIYKSTTGWIISLYVQSFSTVVYFQSLYGRLRTLSLTFFIPTLLYKQGSFFCFV